MLFYLSRLVMQALTIDRLRQLINLKRRLVIILMVKGPRFKFLANRFDCPSSKLFLRHWILQQRKIEITSR